MRHRIRDLTTNEFVETKFSHQEFNSSGTLLYQTLSSGRGSYVSKIQKSDLTDQVGRFKDKDGIPIPKVCSHSVTELLLDGSNTISMVANVFGDNYHHTWSGSPGYIAAVVGGLPPDPTSVAYGTPGTPAPIDWFALTTKFYEACDQYIPTELLVGEDIAENDVFVEAVKIALNPSHAVKTFVKTLRPLMRKLLRPSMGHAHDLAKELGNGFLSYNFGVKPAIKDLVACLNAHQVVKARLDFLKQNRGSFVPIFARQKRYANNAPFSFNPTDFPFMAVRSTWGNGVAERVGTMTGWGRVRHDLNQKSSWAAYAQYFGVQHIVGLAWELIPFSFVVDWVTNAQERIRNLTQLKLGGPYSELRAFCCAEKLTQPFSLVINPGASSIYSNYNGDFSTPIKIGSGRISTFSRGLVPPDGATVADFSGWGLFQTLASGALILQRT